MLPYWNVTSNFLKNSTGVMKRAAKLSIEWFSRNLRAKSASCRTCKTTTVSQALPYIHVGGGNLPVNTHIIYFLSQHQSDSTCPCSSSTCSLLYLSTWPSFSLLLYQIEIVPTHSCVNTMHCVITCQLFTIIRRLRFVNKDLNMLYSNLMWCKLEG